MAGENEALRNIGVSHEIGLRRLSTGVVKKITGLLDQATVDIIDQINKLDPTSIAARFQRDRLNRLLKELKALNKGVYKQVSTTLKNDLLEIGAYEAKFQQKATTPVIGSTVEEFTLPSRQKLVAAVTEEPFQGALLSEWVDGLEVGAFRRLRDAIRIGFVEGEGISQIVRRVRGTAALGFKDGVMAISKRSAEGMVRTAVNATATAARQMTYEENEDILDGWQFVATLEPTTCAICAALDGEIFSVGEGPVPPRHINCRCTTVPVVTGSDRADRVSFSSWLKEQPEDVQDDTLGPTRGKLYREGKLSITKFADDNRVFTLDELAKKEPRAFKRAGV